MLANTPRIPDRVEHRRDRWSIVASLLLLVGAASPAEPGALGETCATHPPCDVTCPGGGDCAGRGPERDAATLGFGAYTPDAARRGRRELRAPAFRAPLVDRLGGVSGRTSEAKPRHRRDRSHDRVAPVPARGGDADTRVIDGANHHTQTVARAGSWSSDRVPAPRLRGDADRGRAHNPARAGSTPAPAICKFHVRTSRTDRGVLGSIVRINVGHRHGDRRV